MTDDGRIPVKRALISVSDKDGLLDLACGLHGLGVEIVSTGGTATAISKASVPVTTVEEVTSFPEILDGRVKTMHPLLMGGLLAKQDNPKHLEVILEFGIELFQLVVVNLYPFEKTVASGADEDKCIENIDIGGPSMLRAAAKNHSSVAVVTNPDYYDEVLAAVHDGGFTLQQRRRYMAEAFRHTAEYDIAVATWAGQELVPDDLVGDFPSWMATVYVREDILGYGENPHQGAAKYVNRGSSTGLASARQLNGKPMSRNNYWDANAARRAVSVFHDEPAVAIIKHSTPCGIAVGADVAEAHRKAHACDPVSAFGGVIAINREVTRELAEQIVPVFTEVVVAPSYADGALEILAAKENLRVLEVATSAASPLEHHPIDGGMLVQTMDRLDQPGDDPGGWTLAAGEPPDETTLADLFFAWRAVRSVKSNAIVAAADGATVGIGTGQPNRIDSCRDAVRRAGAQIVGSAVASDAFFPYPDGPEVLIKAGVRAIVHPGGSKKDDLTVELCEQYGVSLYFTGVRHFAH